MEKQAIISGLRAFVALRPGIEPGNYSTFADYRKESREVTGQRHDAERMLRWLELSGIDGESIAKELSSGRLTLDARGIDYIPGQYWCVEYRAAVCGKIANLFWARCRDNGLTTRDEIRKAAKRELGAPIMRRWFN